MPDPAQDSDHRHDFAIVISGPAPIFPRNAVTTLRRCACGRWEYQELAARAGLDAATVDRAWAGLLPA